MGDYDVDAVNDRLGGKGSERAADGSATRWTSGHDFEIDFEGPFAGVVQTNQFNSVRTADGSFAYAPSRSGVDWVTDPGEETLAGDERIGGWRCASGTSWPPGSSRWPPGCSRTGPRWSVSTGRRPPSSGALDGEVPSTRQPWDELLPGWKVEQTGDFVRVTAPADDDLPVGRGLRAMLTRDLQGLT